MAEDASSTDIELDDVTRAWPAVLDNLRQNAPALAATFEGARPVALEDGRLTIGFPAALTFNKRKAEAPDKREQMADAVEATLGLPAAPGLRPARGRGGPGERRRSARRSTTRRWSRS